jgi:hypothetical protein
MKKTFYTPLILLLFFVAINSIGQSVTKRGGLCFRVDDNPSLLKLHQFDSVFSKHQANFCMAMTSWAFPINPVYVDSLKSWITKGHEVMDNTPTHQTQFFNVVNLQDTILYHNHGGVDHINLQKVCLRITNFDTTQSHGEGLIDITGNQVISQNPGEFGDLAGNPYYFALYLSSPVNELCLWYDLRAVNPADPDTVSLRTFWDEAKTFGSYTGVAYHKITQRNVIMSQTAIRLLGQRTLTIFEDLEIPRPTTWIHPAGQMPWINVYEVKANFGDSLNFTQGSNFMYYSYLGYNEYNPAGYAPFGMQSLDMSTETQSLAQVKHTVANAVAKHLVKIDVARFVNPTGGWDGYLSRTDSLLSWCSAGNIPVRTYDQWRALLYDSIAGRVVNIFPQLNVDLDADSIPDGYDVAGMNGFYDITDGVPASGNRSFAIYGGGNICSINGLAGLEPGTNKFTISTKGTNDTTSIITLTMSFPETGQSISYDVPSDTSIWTEHFQLVAIPEGVSVANILISHTAASYDTVKISGMALRSAGFLNETKLAPQVHTANEPFSSVNLNSLVIDSLYVPESVTWTTDGGSELNFSVLPGNTLQIMKPSSFWVGKDSVYLVAHAPDGITDSCFMAFYSDSIGSGCTGVPIQLSLLDTLDNDIVQWTSIPYDSSISNPSIYNPVVAPKVTTTYYILAINPLGPINRDTITLERYPFPEPVLTGDTSVCYGYSVALIVSGGVSYLWSTGQTNDTIIVNPPESMRYYVRVFNEYGCYVDDSVLLTRVDKPVIELWGLWPAYCANDPSSTVFGKPVGGTYYGSPGLIGDTFYPDLAPSGINKIYYTYTAPSGCSNLDSLTVNVIPLPVVQHQPDTSVCADKSIVLHAGPGFDNYLWSNGKTDSVISFDTTGYGLGLHEVYIYVTKDGCAGMDTAYLNFIICPIGFDSWQTSALLQVYPNPASAEIFIRRMADREAFAGYEIYSVTGQAVLSGHLQNPLTRINILNIPGGSYLIRIRMDGRDYLYKFIKQ